MTYGIMDIGGASSAVSYISKDEGNTKYMKNKSLKIEFDIRKSMFIFTYIELSYNRN